MTRSPGILLCDAEGLRPDVVTLDALARLRLAAARLGMELELCHCSPELRAVIVFAGLEAVLTAAGDATPPPAPAAPGPQKT
jgi:hypothetical protein